jgi:hypothetical protein
MTSVSVRVQKPFKQLVDVFEDWLPAEAGTAAPIARASATIAA